MRRATSLIAALSGVVCAASMGWAQTEPVEVLPEPIHAGAPTDTNTSDVPTTDAVVVPPGGGDSSASDTAEATEEDNAWRFKFHNNHWWYWMPGEYWVYWDAGRWVVYDKATYRIPEEARVATSGSSGWRRVGRVYPYGPVVPMRRFSIGVGVGGYGYPYGYGSSFYGGYGGWYGPGIGFYFGD